MSTRTPPAASATGWELARPFGIPVYVNGSWILASVVIAFVFTPYITAQVPGLGGLAVLVAGAFAVLLGLSVLVHELAHSVAALALGLRVRRITLHLLGGVSEIAGDVRRPWADLAIAVVGPLASLLLAGVGFVVTQLLEPGTVVHLVAWQLTAANVLVGLFNLLPGLPLDGGRILRDVVWGATGNETTGTVIAAWCGRVVAAGLVLLTGYPILRGSFDLVWLLWGVLLASFIWVNAGIALRDAQVRRRLPQITARSLTRRALPVPVDTPVSQALSQMHDAGAGALVTVDAQFRPVGIVHEDAVRAVPSERRPWVSVGAVSRSIAGMPPLGVDTAGDDLVAALEEHRAPDHLVVTDSGEVYGVLSRADVQAAVAGLARRHAVPAPEASAGTASRG